MNDQLIVLVCIAGAVALVAYFVAQFILNRGEEGKLRNRLKGGGREQRRAGASSNTRFKDLVQNLGQKAAKPFMPFSKTKALIPLLCLVRSVTAKATQVSA